MRKFIVGGMSCAACSARVEKAVSAVSGVKACNVNLLTGTMTVEGKASDADIINAVVTAGYTAKTEGSKEEKAVSVSETKALKNRLIYSVVFLIILMYFSMGYVMWGAPLPAFFSENPMAIALLQLLLTIAVMIINKKFFINGFKGIINKAPIWILLLLWVAEHRLFIVFTLFLL